MERNEPPKDVYKPLTEWRLRTLEDWKLRVDETLATLATKQDIADIKTSIEQGKDRRNEWFKTVIGGALAGVLASGMLLVVQAMLASSHPIVSATASTVAR